MTMPVLSPLNVGLQLGLAGAGAGLGYAAIHRAIRLKHGNADPVAVVRPMVVGALIGSTLGVVAAARKWKSDNAGSPYAGLKTAMDKQAIFDKYDDFVNAHPFLSTAGYFTPGVSAAMSAADATRNFSRGEWIRGLGNLALVPLGVFGGTAIAKALPRLAQTARTAKMLKNTRAAAGAANIPSYAAQFRALAPTQGFRGAVKGHGRAAIGAVLGERLANANPASLQLWADRANKVNSALFHDATIKGRRVHNWLPWIGGGMAMFGGSPQPQGAPAYAAMQRMNSTPSFLRGGAAPTPYRGLASMSNENPSKLPFNGAEPDSPYDAFIR